MCGQVNAACTVGSGWVSYAQGGYLMFGLDAACRVTWLAIWITGSFSASGKMPGRPAHLRTGCKGVRWDGVRSGKVGLNKNESEWAGRGGMGMAERIPGQTKRCEVLVCGMLTHSISNERIRIGAMSIHSPSGACETRSAGEGC